MNRRRFKLAAAQYPIDWLDGWPSYVSKLTGWVETAAGEGASNRFVASFRYATLASAPGPAGVALPVSRAPAAPAPG